MLKSRKYESIITSMENGSVWHQASENQDLSELRTEQIKGIVKGYLRNLRSGDKYSPVSKIASNILIRNSVNGDIFRFEAGTIYQQYKVLRGIRYYANCEFSKKVLNQRAKQSQATHLMLLDFQA